MTTSPQYISPRIWEDLAPGTGPQYRSLLCLSRKNRTSSPLQVLNFRGLVWTAGTVLLVLPIPANGKKCRQLLSLLTQTTHDKCGNVDDTLRVPASFSQIQNVVLGPVA